MLGWMTKNVKIRLFGARYWRNQIIWMTCGRFTREADTGETIYIPCAPKTTGRSLRIITSEEILILCEVAIYGKQG